MGARIRFTKYSSYDAEVFEVIYNGIRQPINQDLYNVELYTPIEVIIASNYNNTKSALIRINSSNPGFAIEYLERYDNRFIFQFTRIDDPLYSRVELGVQSKYSAMLSEKAIGRFPNGESTNLNKKIIPSDLNIPDWVFSSTISNGIRFLYYTGIYYNGGLTPITPILNISYISGIIIENGITYTFNGEINPFNNPNPSYTRYCTFNTDWNPPVVIPIANVQDLSEVGNCAVRIFAQGTPFEILAHGSKRNYYKQVADIISGPNNPVPKFLDNPSVFESAYITSRFTYDGNGFILKNIYPKYISTYIGYPDPPNGASVFQRVLFRGRYIKLKKISLIHDIDYEAYAPYYNSSYDIYTSSQMSSLSKPPQPFLFLAIAANITDSYIKAKNPFRFAFEEFAEIGSVKNSYYVGPTYSTDVINKQRNNIVRLDITPSDPFSGKSEMVENCYIDNELAINTGYLRINELKTTLEMKNIDTFLPEWDFVSTWQIDPAINEGYPFLKGEAIVRFYKAFIKTTEDIIPCNINIKSNEGFKAINQIGIKS